MADCGILSTMKTPHPHARQRCPKLAVERTVSIPLAVVPSLLLCPEPSTQVRLSRVFGSRDPLPRGSPENRSDVSLNECEHGVMMTGMILM